MDGSTPDQVGRAVVAVLSPEHEEATKNQHIFVRSFRVTQNQVLAALEKATDTKWTVVPNKAKDISDQGKEIYRRLTEGRTITEASTDPELATAIGLMVTSGIMGHGTITQFEDKAKYWMDKLGLEDEDAEKAIMKAVKAASGVSQK